MKDILEIKEQIANALFEDSFNNVSILLKVIDRAYKQGLIDNSPEFKDLMTVYSAFCSNDVSVLKTLKRFEGQSLVAPLYDIYKQAQYASFEAINKECYNFDQKDIDESLQQGNVEVYNIKKLPKKMLVNVARVERNAKLSKQELEAFWDKFVGVRSFRKIKSDFKSLSFISNHDMHLFRDVSQCLTFVYPNDIPKEYLITITRKDAFVTFGDKEPTTRMAPFYAKPQTLLDSTNEYNEVAVIRQDPHNDAKPIVQPVAILCTKEITPLEYQMAKKFGLKIIYSEASYKQKKYTTKKELPYKTNWKDGIKYDFDEIQK